MQNQLIISEFEAKHFKDVMVLGNHVHGDNYLSDESIAVIHQLGLLAGLNASFVAYDGDKLVGFRLTYAPGAWNIDKWCTTNEWGHAKEKVCYFKCNTVDESCRGQGIGSLLLKRSIEIAKKQGSEAGIAHIWMQSPGNSAFRYMTKAGAKVVKTHPERWLGNSLNEGYHCVICHGECHCDAAEMIIHF
jgi:GNAT superfamily N-acetyltransferase